MDCGLCKVHFGLYIVHCVLCIVYCTLCNLYCVLCIVHFGLCIVLVEMQLDWRKLFPIQPLLSLFAAVHNPITNQFEQIYFLTL